MAKFRWHARAKEAFLSSQNKSTSISEEIEELCGMSVEEKREKLDRTITDKMRSSANLGFYPSRQILRKALLADENEDFGDVLTELTGDFIDEFIEIIREIFSTRM